MFLCCSFRLMRWTFFFYCQKQPIKSESREWNRNFFLRWKKNIIFLQKLRSQRRVGDNPRGIQPPITEIAFLLHPTELYFLLGNKWNITNVDFGKIDLIYSTINVLNLNKILVIPICRMLVKKLNVNKYFKEYLSKAMVHLKIIPDNAGPLATWR